MSGKVLEIESKDQFDKLTGSGKKVIADFYADWCGPCKLISPKFVDLAALPENADITFVKVNVDNLPDIAAQVGISSMPTFQTFNGSEDNRRIGAKVSGLLELVESFKPKPETVA